ncbi:MAG: zinc ribbon domain-containing protein [Armatimonadota bacterium]
MEYTPSPRLIVLQNVVNAIKSGQTGEDALKQVIDIVTKDLGDLLMLEQDETIFLDPNSKARWEVMKKAINEYQKGLSDLGMYLQDKKVERMDKAMEDLSVADKKLYEIYAEMNDIFQKAKEELEASLFVNCIFCSHKNPKEAKICGGCGKTLTKGFQEITEYADLDEDTGQIGEFYEEVEEYSNISRFKELAYGVVEGKVKPKELLGYTLELKGLFKGALNQFESAKPEEKNLYPEIVANISDSRQTIGELLSTLDEVISGLKAGDTSDLESRITKVEEFANRLGIIKQNFISISQQLSDQM